MPEPKIIYEDENFLAIDKPAGLLVHPVRGRGTLRVLAASNGVHEAYSLKRETWGTGGKQNVSSSKLQVSSGEPTLVDWLLKNYPEVKTVGDDPVTRPGIVHRLDRDTSGVMVVAKNQKAFDYLKGLFQKREIKKTYLALVWGGVRPSRGVIDKPIALKGGTTKHTVYKGKMEKEAITEYGVIKNFQIAIPNFQKIPNSKFQIPNSFTLLEVYPKTGRTHQIRVHLASIGHPVVGDRIYGGKRNEERGKKYPISNIQYPKRLMLHALSLEFVKEDGGRIRIEAEPPEEMTYDL